MLCRSRLRWAAVARCDAAISTSGSLPLAIIPSHSCARRRARSRLMSDTLPKVRLTLVLPPILRWTK